MNLHSLNDKISYLPPEWGCWWGLSDRELPAPESRAGLPRWYCNEGISRSMLGFRINFGTNAGGWIWEIFNYNFGSIEKNWMKTTFCGWPFCWASCCWCCNCCNWACFPKKSKTESPRPFVSFSAPNACSWNK